MKFQHGILGDDRRPEPPAPEVKTGDQGAIAAEIEKNRLFETLEEEKAGGRHYLKAFSIVVVAVLVAAAAFFYFTLPNFGDQVRAPAGMELAIRDHLLTKQRTATDVEVYYCGEFYWARVGVESRTDVPGNPLAAVKTYTARVTPAGVDTWQVEASPLTDPDVDVPCNPSFAIYDQR